MREQTSCRFVTCLISVKVAHQILICRYRPQFGTELVYMRGGGCKELPRLLCTPWAQFDFFPGHPSTVMLVQKGSCRILAAEMPLSGPPAAAVYLVGEHRGLLTCTWNYICMAEWMTCLLDAG